MEVDQVQVGANEVTQNEPIVSYDWVLDPKGTNGKHGLAIGNYIFAKNTQLLKENNIYAVVSVFGETEIKYDNQISHFRILIGDNPSENIKCFFDSSSKFISEHLKNCNVLVHCKAGVSRSATIVAAYLMKTHKMDFHTAINLLKSKRKLVEPNRGFLRQLRIYDRELREQREKDNCLCY